MKESSGLNGIKKVEQKKKREREREREEGGGGKSEEKTLRVDGGWWMLLDTAGVNSRTAIHLCPGRKSSPPSLHYISSAKGAIAGNYSLPSFSY